MIGFKDICRLFGIATVCFCAVFVCTFFLNYYLDVSHVSPVPAEALTLYKAQRATAKFTCLISGGFLGVVAVVMLLFYVRLFIRSHTVQLGILKAMGYSSARIACKFWVFGFSVLLGAGLGYGFGHAAMPYIYKNMTITGMPAVRITYHPSLLFLLVLLPSAVYSCLACLFAFLYVRRPTCDLLRDRLSPPKPVQSKAEKPRPFLRAMFLSCITSKKLLMFFVFFGAFCFSAMVQMGFSMDKVSASSMATMILLIGLVLAVVSLWLAINMLVDSNAENVSIMKAFGYTAGECARAAFGGCVPFALVGFGVGTLYQYGLLKVMVNVVFDGVEGVSKYTFGVPLFFATFAAFVVFFSAVLALCFFRLRRISVKQSAGE